MVCFNFFSFSFLWHLGEWKTAAMWSDEGDSKNPWNASFMNWNKANFPHPTTLFLVYNRKSSTGKLLQQGVGLDLACGFWFKPVLSWNWFSKCPWVAISQPWFFSSFFPPVRECTFLRSAIQWLNQGLVLVNSIQTMRFQSSPHTHG